MKVQEQTNKIRGFIALFRSARAKELTKGEIEAIAVLHNVEYGLLIEALAAGNSEGAAKVLGVTENELADEMDLQDRVN